MLLVYWHVCSEKCEGPLYCTDTCLDADAIGHIAWCAPMKRHMQEVDELAQFPFTFTKGSTSHTNGHFTQLKIENGVLKVIRVLWYVFLVTSARDFGEEQYEKFLRNLGVYGKGLWRRESKLETLGKCSQV